MVSTKALERKVYIINRTKRSKAPRDLDDYNKIINCDPYIIDLYFEELVKRDKYALYLSFILSIIPAILSLFAIFLYRYQINNLFYTLKGLLIINIYFIFCFSFSLFLSLCNHMRIINRKNSFYTSYYSSSNVIGLVLIYLYFNFSLSLSILSGNNNVFIFGFYGALVFLFVVNRGVFLAAGEYAVKFNLGKRKL